MEETEWEYRNRKRQERLNKNIYTFQSKTDEEKLHQRRNMIVINAVSLIILIVVFAFMLIVTVMWFALGNEKYTFGEWLLKCLTHIPRMFDADIWRDMYQDSRMKRNLQRCVFGMFALIPIIIYYFRQTKKSYNKNIIIDLNTNQITYQEEKKADVVFGIDEIKKWVYFKSVQRHAHGDAFVLKDERIIQIDGFFDDKVHQFLESHAEELKLPKKAFVFAYQLDSINKWK